MIIAINRVEDWATKNLVEDIMEVSKFFFDVTFNFVFRNFYRATNNLAKLGFELEY